MYKQQFFGRNIGLKNGGRGLHMRPFVNGVVELLNRDMFFSNQYSSGIQTSLCKLLHGY